ncbi:hypothetical protein AAG906_040926 [Vitis piasezkii]
MQSFERSLGIRSFSTSDSASLWKNVASLLDSLSIKPGGTLVQNCGDCEIGEVALGGDLVVLESHTKTWYMKRLLSELKPSVGLNFCDGFQATSVCKAVATGGNFSHMGRSYPSMSRTRELLIHQLSGALFMKDKKLKVVNL